MNALFKLPLALTATRRRWSMLLLAQLAVFSALLLAADIHVMRKLYLHAAGEDLGSPHLVRLAVIDGALRFAAVAVAAFSLLANAAILASRGMAALGDARIRMGEPTMLALCIRYMLQMLYVTWVSLLTVTDVSKGTMEWHGFAAGAFALLLVVTAFRGRGEACSANR